MASHLAVEQLAEIVPLPFLRRLAVKPGFAGVLLEEIKQRVAPFVREPQRLKVVH